MAKIAQHACNPRTPIKAAKSAFSPANFVKTVKTIRKEARVEFLQNKELYPIRSKVRLVFMADPSKDWCQHNMPCRDLKF